jgi:hypothetical protein
MIDVRLCLGRSNDVRRIPDSVPVNAGYRGAATATVRMVGRPAEATGLARGHRPVIKRHPLCSGEGRVALSRERRGGVARAPRQLSRPVPLWGATLRRSIATSVRPQRLMKGKTATKPHWRHTARPEAVCDSLCGQCHGVSYGTRLVLWDTDCRRYDHAWIRRRCPCRKPCRCPRSNIHWQLCRRVQRAFM